MQRAVRQVSRAVQSSLGQHQLILRQGTDFLAMFSTKKQTNGLPSLSRVQKSSGRDVVFLGCSFCVCSF